MQEEKITPVTEDEADDIRVTLEFDEGTTECKILFIYDVGEQEYIALCPLDEDGNELPEGDVYLYRYSEDDEGLPSIDNIEDDEEYERAADRFDELLDEQLFEDMD